jgi:tetratricopeptide (TPR) repeat protein
LRRQSARLGKISYPVAIRFHIFGVIPSSLSIDKDFVLHLRVMRPWRPTSTPANPLSIEKWVQSTQPAILVVMIVGSVGIGAQDHGDYQNAYDLGTLALHRGDVAAAITEFRRAVEINPESAEGRNAPGAALGRRGDVSNSITYLQEAVRL